MQAVTVFRGPEVENRRARLVVRPPAGAGRVDGVALVLHGGRARSTAPTSPVQVAVVRMLPFGPAVARTAREAGLRVAVASLRYRVRGWNGARRDPVVDATWALSVLAEQFPGVPVVLVGHSMGGRTALALADDPRVAGVVGLAPWVEPDDTVGAVAGRRVDVLHGTADRMTDPRASRAWTERAGRRGAVVSYTPVAGAGHAMLGRPGRWHEAAAEAVVTDLRAAGTTRQDVDPQSTTDHRFTTGSRRQS